MVPRVISLDTEAYGKVKRLPDGRAAPHQTVFHPRRMLYTDRARLSDLVLTTNITIPQEDPRCTTGSNVITVGESGSTESPSNNTGTTTTHLSPASILSPSSGPTPTSITPPTERTPECPSTGLESSGSSWSGSRLARLEGGPTFVSRMHLPQEANFVHQWLAHSDTILGTNLQYDILTMRASDPRLRVLLDGRHLLIDLTVLSYLHSEVRESHSLKNVGRSFGTSDYDEEPDPGEDYKRYKDVNDPGLTSYGGQDSHNTVVNIAEAARRIARDYPGTWKLSEFCLRFYSNTIWTCIRMAEAGVPMSRSYLERLENHLQWRIQRCVQLCNENHGLLLEGKGSEKSKQAFITRLIQEIDSCPVSEIGSNSSSPSESASSLVLPSASSPPARPSVLDHPALVKTDIKHQVSFNTENRNLFLSLLQPEPRDSTSPPTASPLQPSSTTRSSATETSASSTTSPPPAPASPTSLRQALKLAQSHSQLSKIVNTYTFPLLHHKRKKPLKQQSCLIPQFNPWAPLPGRTDSCGCSTCVPSAAASVECVSPSTPPSAPSASSTARSSSPDVWFSYPTWFVTPSASKDEGGAKGGTIQIRVTCKNHAHQTDPPIIQKAIQSRFGDAGCILKMDLSQIELRVPGILSGEPYLISEYNSPNPDLHTKCAVDVFGEPFLIDKYGPNWRKHPIFRKATNGERQVGKHTNFGRVYRASPETLHSTVLEMTGLDLPMATFIKVQEDVKTVMPVMYAWQESLLDTAEKVGYLEIPLLGVTRRFTGFKRKGRDREIKNMQNEVVNFPIQAFAGATLLDVQHQLLPLLPPMNDDRARCYMFLNTYDSINFDCHYSYRPRLESILQEAVDRTASLGLWGQMQELTGNRIPLVYELTLCN